MSYKNDLLIYLTVNRARIKHGMFEGIKKHVIICRLNPRYKHSVKTVNHLGVALMYIDFVLNINISGI